MWVAASVNADWTRGMREVRLTVEVMMVYDVRP